LNIPPPSDPRKSTLHFASKPTFTRNDEIPTRTPLQAEIQGDMEQGITCTKLHTRMKNSKHFDWNGKVFKIFANTLLP